MRMLTANIAKIKTVENQETRKKISLGNSFFSFKYLGTFYRYIHTDISNGAIILYFLFNLNSFFLATGFNCTSALDES